MSMQISASASMASEAENYELGEKCHGYCSGGSNGARYYKFSISTKSHVTLYANKQTGSTNFTFDIYNKSGKIVLKSQDIKYKFDNINSIYKGNKYVTLEKGIYYLKVYYNSYGGSDFSFRIEAEKQIKLPKGSISYLKSRKKGQFTVSCKKSKDAIGYRIQYSTDYRFKKGVKTIYSPSATKTITKLKAGTRYYVKVCPFTVYDDGVRVFGQNSLVKQVVTRKK